MHGRMEKIVHLHMLINHSFPCVTKPYKIKFKYTVVATSTCSSLKPSISPSNVALNSNPGTVLETARPEDSKTPPTC